MQKHEDKSFLPLGVAYFSGLEPEMIAIDTSYKVFYVIDAEGTLVVTKNSLDEVLKSFYEECKLDS
jgi:hypothetical protein